MFKEVAVTLSKIVILCYSLAAVLGMFNRILKPSHGRIAMLIPSPNENSAKILAPGDSQSLLEGLKWLMENTEDIVINSN